jgi:predicted component of type VI protein secretion system
MSQPLIGRFDKRGGTLGRSDDATLTLPDPERLISRIQAQVLHRDEHYWLENISAASAVLHNGRPLSTGMRVILGEGDELRIGGYALQATFEDETTSAAILRGRTVVPPVPSSSVERITTGPDGTESLWRNFLQGAGIDASSLPDAPTPQLLSSIGEMLKIAVGGLQRLVTMRARVKNEMQGEMTLIAARDNNPLKFSPGEALVLQMLLQPPAPGFLDGPAALRDALTDLQSHQVGMTAGTGAVLQAVLDRLDPEKLATLQGRRSVFDLFRPARRRARLWDTYLTQYRSLREEAENDFQRTFAGVFRDAYETRVLNPATPGDTTGLRPRSGKVKPQTPQQRR